MADALSRIGHDVAVIDRDSTAFNRLSPEFAGDRVLGQGFDRDVLLKAGIEGADAFAAVSSGDNSNIISARLARETFGVHRVVARIYDAKRAEVYERLVGERIWEQPWPTADPAMLVAETFELVCQVNGKVRDRVTAPSDAERSQLEQLALGSPGVQQHVNAHEVVKVVVVPGKLVNVVVK